MMYSHVIVNFILKNRKGILFLYIEVTEQDDDPPKIIMQLKC